MTLSEVRQLLQRRGIQLTKSLGQNFLHNTHYLDRIAVSAEMTPEDRVLEIGPGLGSLTEMLVAKAGTVIAIEQDARLVRMLEERFRVAQASGLPADPGQPTAGKSPALFLLHADALRLLQETPRDWSDWKVVSNLPYSVASPILVELCQGSRSPQRMVVTLQFEVVERLMAQCGSKSYGVLTLMVQPDFEPVEFFKIPPGCFFPPPAVESACLVLKRRSSRLLPDEIRPVYVRIVKRAFGQRRKMMLKLLKQDWALEALAEAFDHTGLSPQTRAEAVNLEQFVALTQFLVAISTR